MFKMAIFVWGDYWVLFMCLNEMLCFIFGEVVGKFEMFGFGWFRDG